MEERPRIRLTLTRSDKLMEAAGILVLLFAWVYIASCYAGLPGTIPTHFGATGAPDDYGPKIMIFLLPAIATVVYASLTLLNQYPHVFNYPANITAANAHHQYTAATRFIRFIKLVIALSCTYIALQATQAMQGKNSSLGAWFLPVLLTLFFLPLVIFLVKTFRSSKTNAG
jgi:uncharacterized membrane protein